MGFIVPHDWCLETIIICDIFLGIGTWLILIYLKYNYKGSERWGDDPKQVSTHPHPDPKAIHCLNAHT